MSNTPNTTKLKRRVSCCNGLNKITAIHKI